MSVKRNTNLDLLRILSMLMVVILHTMGHGGLIQNTLIPGTFNYYICNIVYAFSLVAVNCFVMISGYFLCTSGFKLKKLVQVWGLALFFSVTVYLVLVGIGSCTFSLRECVKSILVMTTKRYWFVTAYLLLYMASPFLNYAIKAMDKKAHLTCCVVMLAVFSVLSNVVYIFDFSGINGGYSFPWFCILYIIAAYFRLYVPERIKHQKMMLPGYCIAAFIICLERFIAYIVTPLIFGEVHFESLFYSYNSIFTVTATLCLFQFFRGIHLKEGKVSKLISRIAPLTFTVYLIHDHDTFRAVLWNWLHPGAYYDKIWLIGYAAACVLLVFTGCCILEWIRSLLSGKLGISDAAAKLCDRIQTHADEIITRFINRTNET